MDGVQAVSWSEARTLAHTTISLHRRFCEVIDGARALWSHLSFAVYHFMIRKCCPCTWQQSMYASHNVMVHTVCPYGQHLYICALMRKCQAGHCSSSSCCLHLSSWLQVFVSSWQHPVQPVVIAVVYQTDIPSKIMRSMLSTIAAGVNYFADKLFTDAGRPECICRVSRRCDWLIQQLFGAHSFDCF